VLNNLLSNAIKYSPEAEHIIIRLTSTSKHLTVSVQDFRYRYPSNRAGEKSSSASIAWLGSTGKPLLVWASAYPSHIRSLSTMKEKLWIESVEGQGSTFSFSLPPALIYLSASQDPLLELLA